MDVRLAAIIVLQIVHALRLVPARVLELVVEAASAVAAGREAGGPVDSEPEPLFMELVRQLLDRGVGERGRRLQVAGGRAVELVPA